MLNQNLWYIQ